ncbi:ornithine cyclodeaminase [Paenibacillus sp. UNC496MF]|uniref:tyramine oxidase subunit B n=1 Tax=Paenibacillus sp. UNC496MF TaxID=1502753 RepID=UPI0008E0ADB0|nr:tyramine oxidase subunit B [Paenibacillus sp. UNC496MF]SFJ54765.1 ornithine cyclodeaminase [Paenibacillus sp. UNC496MF]
MGKRTEFLYMSEPDVIEAGVLDVKMCVNSAEEVFKLLVQGDYLMGGNNHNNHGMYIVFPKETPFPNMPVAGPDRRFVAMPAYLGGRFDICGQKWYGSNAENKIVGLPRSVLMLTLNNKSTGEPLAYMSANLISAARTGAVPAVGARYLTRKDSKVLTLVGCGPIGKACFDSIITELPNVEKVICNNRSEAKAVSLATYIKKNYALNAVVENSLESAAREADVISVAASRTAPLHFRHEWIKQGCTILASGPLQCDESLWMDTDIVYDHIGLHHAYVEDAIESGDKEAYYSGVIGGPIYRLIDAGKKPAIDDSVSIGQVIIGKNQGRISDKQIICFVSCGMSVFDLGLGYDLYMTALEKGIGKKLLLWESPKQSEEA